MAHMLLINPRRRKSAKKASGSKRRKSSAKRASTTTVAAVRRRRRNPIAARRRNPIGRRRRNPIGLGGGSNKIMSMLTDALLGGAGAVAVDMAMGQINNLLPLTLRRVPGSVGLGDAVKAGITVLLGSVLDKPTKGAARKMAAGALTVQAADLLRSFVPTTMQLGYASPALVAPGTMRVGPAYRPGVGAYTSSRTRSPLLNGVGAYTGSTSGSPLLSGLRRGGMSQARREGYIVR